ncbi:MAG TPA: hypothetical protein VHC22_14555 [Pirellulales bacterium]|nr:hypothetical protein [Pirellulales bacterium]
MMLPLALIGLGCALLGVAAWLYARMGSGEPHSIEPEADFHSPVAVHGRD